MEESKPLDMENNELENRLKSNADGDQKSQSWWQLLAGSAFQASIE